MSQLKHDKTGPVAAKPLATSGSGFRNPLQSVGGKIFITFFISIVCFVLVTGLISYQVSRTIIQDKVSQFSQQALSMARDKLDIVYQRYETLSLQFVIDRNYQNTISSFFGSTDQTYEKFMAVQEMEKALQSIMYSDTTVAGIHIFDLKGGHAFSYPSVSGPENVGEQEWFQTVMDLKGRAFWKPSTTESYLTPKRTTFGITRVLSLNGAPTAVVLIEVLVDELVKQLDTMDLGDGGQIYIMDKNHQVVMSMNPEEIGTESTLTLPFNESQELMNLDPFQIVDENGEERIVIFEQSAIPTNGWVTVGTVLVDGLVKDARQIFNYALIISLVAAILATLIGAVMARNIGGPLKKLTALMQQGEQGKLSGRTSFKNRDEIGKLGLSYNSMMEQITQLVRQTNESAQNVLETAGKLSEVSKQTAMSAKEISVATEQIAGGASTLASEAERGNELTMNIGDQMKRVIESNLEMGKAASEVSSSSEQGTEYMAFVIDQTNETEAMTRSMVEKVNHLKESTASIRKILELLNGITKQTNILSLNATIEASRAGAAGKGFMVVADEIRKLADQSKESIQVVGDITETIQTEIDQTVDVLSKAYPIFQEQTRSVKEADVIFHKVQTQMGDFIVHLDDVTASIQQLEDSQNVLSEAMSSVSAVSQESSATSEEVASLTTEQLNVSDGLVNLADQLERLSKSLKEALGKFSV